MSGFHYVRGPCQTTQVVVPATDTVATFVGDPIGHAGSADTTDYLPTGAVVAAGSPVLGVCVGFEPSRLYEDQKHRTASTKRIANVVLAMPGTVFKVKSDAEMLVSEVGLLFDHQSGAGSATTGRSGYVLDNSGTGATASGQWRFLGVLRDTDNMNISATPGFADKDASATNVWCLVQVNESYQAIGSAGV